MSEIASQAKNQAQTKPSSLLSSGSELAIRYVHGAAVPANQSKSHPREASSERHKTSSSRTEIMDTREGIHSGREINLVDAHQSLPLKVPEQIPHNPSQIVPWSI